MLLIFIVIAPVLKTTAQDFDTKAKMKAVYVYNFATYTQWPESSKQGNFVIGVYGNYPALMSFFEQVAKTNKVGLQGIEVKKFTSVSEIVNSHILFIINEESAQLSAIIKKVKGKNTLLVTDKKGLGLKGSGISFFSEANKQKFELNKANIENHGLKVSSNLLKLTDVVY